jgi:F-type H+-transporting ATPase subunit delta
VSDGGDFLKGLESAAREVMREIGERADLGGLKEALERVEGAGEGIVEAVVTSAVALTDDERAELERRLRAAYGEDLRIRTKVDPAILGGLVVRVGDRYLDGSVAAKIGQLHQTLTGGSVG